VGSATKTFSFSLKMLIYLRSIEQPSYFLKSSRPESILRRRFYAVAMASTARPRLLAKAIEIGELSYLLSL